MTQSKGKRLILTGASGCGKSTLTKALASMLPGLETIDLDEMIEQREGLAISEIFARHGEACFRAAERRAMEDALAADFDILATGGGTPCQPGAMDRLLAGGRVFYLRCQPEKLAERLMLYGAGRPITEGLDATQMLDKCRSLLAAREVHYMRSHAVFDASRLDTPREILASAKEFIKSELPELSHHIASKQRY